MHAAMMPPDDEDDEIEFERFMSLSEAQQEAEFGAAMREYTAMTDAMTGDQYYAWRRRNGLRLALSQRRLIRESPYMNFLKPRLKETQKRMVALRHFRRTGIWPGSDA